MKKDVEQSDKQKKCETISRDKKMLEYIMAMISFRDALIMREGIAGEPGNENIRLLLKSLLKEMAMMMKNNGIANTS